MAEQEELHSPFRYTIEPVVYEERAFQWEKAADIRLRNSDVIILGGYGLAVKVIDGSLSVEYLRATGARVFLLNGGVHKVKTLICFTHGGYITIDAIEWLCQQNITLYLIDWRGNFLQTLSPRQNCNARLAYLQYKAHESDLALNIARELVIYKARKQALALRQLPIDVPDRTLKRFESVGDELIHIHDIDSLRMAEDRLAAAYWQSFTGIPINWRGREVRSIRHVPANWLTITERLSDISAYSNASQATNPFHAALNFAYALLEAQVLQAINVAGLAPEVGFLHTSNDGSNLLVFDLMESFRPDVDAMVLQFFQKTVFKKGDFLQWHTGECRLNEELKRYVLATCRIDDKAIDIQCRWLRNLLESQ